MFYKDSFCFSFSFSFVHAVSAQFILIFFLSVPRPCSPTLSLGAVISIPSFINYRAVPGSASLRPMCVARGFAARNTHWLNPIHPAAAKQLNFYHQFYLILST